MSHLLKTTTMLSATAAIALLFVSCGENKVAQCNKIIKVANQAVTISQEFSKNPKPAKGSKALTEVAAKIEPLAKEMKTLEIQDEKLQGFQGRFIKLYEDISKGLKDAAIALDKKNIPAANNFLKALQKSSNEETVLVKEINTYCSGK